MTSNREYKLIHGASIESLTEEVNKTLNSSMFWELYGNPVVCSYPGGYYQALRRWGSDKEWGIKNG